MLTAALAFLTVGFLGYAFVESASQGFLASAVTGIGNGLFWPAQSTLLAGLTTRAQRSATFAMQRVVMNLGIGLGGVAGGFIASESFRALFVLDALTFVAYAAVLTVFVPEPAHHEERAARTGSYRTVFRHKVFMALMVANSLYIGAGIPQLEILPAFAKNEAGVSERGIGWLFFINTIVIVLLQLPTTRLAEGGGACRCWRCSAPSPRPRGCSSRRAASGSQDGRVRAARRRRLDLRARRVPARRRPADARRRPRRPTADRPLHGDLGPVLAGRLHGRAGRRRRPPRRLADRALGDDGGGAAPDRARDARRSNAALPESLRRVPGAHARGSRSRSPSRRASRKPPGPRGRLRPCRRSRTRSVRMPSLPRIRRTRHGSGAVPAGARAERRALELTASGLTWVHVDRPDAAAAHALAERFGWHELDVEDVLSKRQRPKVDEYPEYLFGVLHFPVYDKTIQRLNAAELDFFLGPDYLVTLPNVELLPVARLFHRLEEDERLRDELFAKGSGRLLYEVLDDLFDYCFPILDKIGHKLDSVEDDMFERRAEDVVRDLSNVKQEIISYRKIIKPERTTLRVLERRVERFLPEELDLYFDDIVDAAERIWDLLDNYKEVVEGLESTNESVISHRQNDVLRILTVFSATLLPLTLLASVFGMNVAFPGNGTAGAFWVVVAIMVAVERGAARLLPLEALDLI